MKITNSNTNSRLLRDLQKVENFEEDGIYATPIGDNLYKWEACIFGPEATAWQGGIFKLILTFCSEYPGKPPIVVFTIYSDGRICLDIIDKNWSPVYDVLSILISIRSLLSDPNENSPANAEAAQLFVSNPQLYYKKIKEIVDISIKADNDENDDNDEIKDTE